MEEVPEPGAAGSAEKEVSWEDFLHDAAVECFRRRVVASFDEFWRLTPAEYGILRESWELQDLDASYRAAEAAWLAARARDRRKSGSGTALVHTSFGEFFPHEKRERELKRRQRIRSGREEPGDKRLKRLSQHMAEQAKKKAMEGGGADG